MDGYLTRTNARCGRLSTALAGGQSSPFNASTVTPVRLEDFSGTRQHTAVPAESFSSQPLTFTFALPHLIQTSLASPAVCAARPGLLSVNQPGKRLGYPLARCVWQVHPQDLPTNCRVAVQMTLISVSDYHGGVTVVRAGQHSLKQP